MTFCQSEEAQDKILNQVQVDEWEQTQGDDKFWHYTDGANYKNQKRWQGKYPMVIIVMFGLNTLISS